MLKFYFLLWLRWSLRVSASSLFMATVLSILITIYLYINKGMPDFNTELNDALFSIFKFYFPLAWSFTLFIALFRTLKYIFNTPLNGYELKLLACENDEIIDEIAYGDLVKVWRKWFMLMIWLVGAQSIFVLLFTGVDIYILFIEILLAGYLSLVLIAGRCKRVKIIKC